MQREPVQRRAQRPLHLRLPATITADPTIALTSALAECGAALYRRGRETGQQLVADAIATVRRSVRVDPLPRFDIRPGDRFAVVKPGVLNGELRCALEPHGLFWPPDPTSADYSSIGGNLACNASGPRAVNYGASRDNVLALVALTGTGELIRCGTATTNGATGYDLQWLLVGSEGTLALIVEATLRLAPLPAQRRALRALYHDVDSAAAVARLMAQPVTPSMLEFMDGDALALARGHMRAQAGGSDLPEDAGALLMLEADGDADTLPAAVAALQAAARGPGCLGVEPAADEAARERLWAARKALSPALRTLAPPHAAATCSLPPAEPPPTRRSHMPSIMSPRPGRTAAAPRPPQGPPRRWPRASVLTCTLTLLAACGSTPVREDIPPFRAAAATANQQTAQAFTDINAFLRERQIDRAVQQNALSESLFFTALADEDVAKWNRAFGVIDAYAASLEKLLDPQRRTEVQQELVGLGDAIGQIRNEQLPGGVAAGFATLGGLLLQMKTEKDAMAAIRRADPGMQAVFATMQTALGAHEEDAIRGTVRTSWNQLRDERSLDFRRDQGADARRAVVEDYVAILDKRDAQDRSLAALRRSLGLLASAHSALAAGRPGGAGAILDLVQREYALWRAQRESIDKDRATGAKEGAQ